MGHVHKAMDFKTISCLNPEGILSKECEYVPSEEVLLKGYRTMVLTRLVDDRMITLQRQGTISFAMSSLGEEASVVASAAACDQADWLFPQYREDGCIFWRGFSIEDYIHHMFCNSRDSNKGRQMPNHFGCRDLNVVTVSSPLATQLPHAAGAAYAMRLEGDSNIALAYFGEGTTSKGDFHTALNFAAVRGCPVIFFCRNNKYAISTPVEEQFATEGVAERAAAYGVQTWRVDGNDFVAVYDIVRQAREYCLNEKAPTFVEAMTYRRGAHSTSDDPSAYRDDAEVKAWEAKDPIDRLRKYLESTGLWDSKQEKALHEEVKGQIDAAITAAKAAAPPPLRSLVEDVYFAVPDRLEQQYRELRRCFPDKE